VLEDTTRIEVRRVFNPTMSIPEIDARKNPLGDFKVFLIISEAPLSKDPAFHFYLDSVRLRGIVGARKHLKEAMDARKVPKCVGEYEGLLHKNMAPWWEQSGLNASVKTGLKNSASWNELFKYLFAK